MNWNVSVSEPIFVIKILILLIPHSIKGSCIPNPSYCGGRVAAVVGNLWWIPIKEIMDGIIF